jgi:hypothetical protein
MAATDCDQIRSSVFNAVAVEGCKLLDLKLYIVVECLMFPRTKF